MFNLSPLYFPITAKPNHTSEFLPSHALQPFIRCFWGSVDVESIQQPETETIIPDTCMDIIWDLDRESGNTNTFFSGINDTPFEVSSDGKPGGVQPLVSGFISGRFIFLQMIICGMS